MNQNRWQLKILNIIQPTKYAIKNPMKMFDYSELNISCGSIMQWKVFT